MLQIVAENKYGQRINLTNNPDFVTSLVTGLTPAAANINTSAIAGKDGSKHNSSRVGERNITFVIYPRRNIEKTRLNLYRYLQTGEYIKLYLSNGSRSVWIDGYIDTMDGDLYTELQQIPVSIICCNPYFKAVEEDVFEFSTVTANFTFPFSIAEEGEVFSTITTYAEKNIVNSSNKEIGVIIEIYAVELALEPTIYNTTTGESFTLNHEFQIGDVVRIDTRSGSRSVTLIRDGVETNILNQMEKGSNWLKLYPADNIFTYTAAYAPEHLQITINVQPIYGGM